MCRGRRGRGRGVRRGHEGPDVLWTYATALYGDTDATLDDICEAEATLADTERIAERVLGSEHPLTAAIERDLINARGAIADREMGYA